MPTCFSVTKTLGAVVGAVALLSAMPHAGLAQSVAAPPRQMIFSNPEARLNDVYSPKLIYQTINGQKTLVMYFGGWYQTDPYTLPNDSIYRAICTTPTTCGNVQKVIDPVASHMGSASMVNNPTIVELHNAGQDYLMMYMTGVTGDDRNNAQTVSNNKVYYSVSWANDGTHWGVPRLLLDSAWLPSATVDANGDVVLYANTNWHNNQHFLARWNLGPTGLAVGQAQPVVASNGVNYINVEVKYRPNFKAYEIVAQQVTAAFNSEVDYLDSVDGTTWNLRAQNITQQAMTPGMHPDTACWVYYGMAPQIYLSEIYYREF